jgi:lysophospholipase L1-like esterase
MDELVHAPAPFDVCVLAGVNDLQADRAGSAIRTDLAAVYARIIARGGVPLPVTMLPFGGNPTWSPAREVARVEVNDWIRALSYRYTDAEAIGDGDPAQPALQAAYSADGLHPNLSGHAALARMIYAQSFGGVPTPLPDS